MGRQQFGDRYISSHPIAGSDKSGPGQIIPNMFHQKNVIILNRHLIGDDNTGLSLVEKFWTSIGMKLKYVSLITVRRTSANQNASFQNYFANVFSYLVWTMIESLGWFHIFLNTFHIKRSIRPS